MGSNREKRDRLKSIHVFLALFRDGTNQDRRCIRQVIRNYEEDLRFLEMRCIVRGGEWRIYHTVNARDPEKAMRYLMKKLIDHPELCTDVDMEWRTALLQPECIYGEKRFMLDVDTENETVINQLKDLLAEHFPLGSERWIKSPKGWHVICRTFDTRKVCELPDVSLQRDGYYYVKTVGV